MNLKNQQTNKMPEHKEITYDDHGVECIYCKECDNYYAMEEHCLNCGHNFGSCCQFASCGEFNIDWEEELCEHLKE
jgi:hypothetical protein